MLLFYGFPLNRLMIHKRVMRGRKQNWIPIGVLTAILMVLGIGVPQKAWLKISISMKVKRSSGSPGN